MNKATLLVLTGVILGLAGCGAPGGNVPVTNANTNKPGPSTARMAWALIALDRQATDAYFKGDAKFFEGLLSDNFVMVGPGGSRVDKAGAVQKIRSQKCDIKEGWKLEEPHLSAIDTDTYVLNYKGVFDGTCTVDGKTEKVASPVRGATVWVRTGDKWVAAFRGENPIVDLKASASPSAPAPAKDDSVAPQSNTVVPADDPAADALMATEGSVWEAWKAADAAKLEELTNKDLSFVDIFGNVTSTKPDTIKLWSEHKCDVRSVSVSDGVQRPLSPTVSILTFKGTAEGTCYGQEMGGPIYGTSLYVKNGDTWKLAFTMNSL